MAGRAGEAGAWLCGWLTVACDPLSSVPAWQMRLMVEGKAPDAQYEVTKRQGLQALLLFQAGRSRRHPHADLSPQCAHPHGRHCSVLHAGQHCRLSPITMPGLLCELHRSMWATWGEAQSSRACTLYSACVWACMSAVPCACPLCSACWVSIAYLQRPQCRCLCCCIARRCAAADSHCRRVPLGWPGCVPSAERSADAA